MTHTYSALTEAQSRAVRAGYARLLALSRERRQFMRSVRAMAWPVSHVSELWAAHCARRGFTS
jgi:hypothetical protein